MKLKAIKSVLLLFSMLCIFCLPVQVSAETPQGTNGDELQVMKAEQLEIQLGADWAGVEFQLKTDAGVYPVPLRWGRTACSAWKSAEAPNTFSPA